MVKAPVLLLVYNRIDTLEKVWSILERVRPPVLFISGDGAKATSIDQERVRQVRSFVQSRISWQCDAYFRFLPENMGCKRAVSSGISWFFSHVEAGIVLEDDTMPHPTFFLFMDEILERYKDDQRIGMVSGSQLSPGHPALAKGWDFVRIPVIWGWGTWRRVWTKYEMHPPDWEYLKSLGFPTNRLGTLAKYGTYIQRMLDKVINEEVDTWDYQLALLLLREGQLNVIPTQNLVRNLGHGHPLSTNIRKTDWRSFLPLQAWKGGSGPPWIQPNIPYERDIFVTLSFKDKVLHRLRSILYAHGILRFPPDDPLEVEGSQK